MKLGDLRTSKDVLEEHLKDPAFRQRWDRNALARAVATCIVAYRAENGMSQTALAKRLGMKQPAVARLESGEKNPSWETLARIAEALSTEFLVDIVPKGRRPLVEELADRAKVMGRMATGEAGLVVAVG